MNMKLFKMIFNRALRIKTRKNKQGEAMFCYLDRKLQEMLGTPNSYYQSGICLELVRTQNKQDHYQGAKLQLERSRKILADHFGGPESPCYVDYLLRKVEFLGNVALDDHAADSGYDLDEDEIEQVKQDLANTSEAFMRLTEKINAPARNQ